MADFLEADDDEVMSEQSWSHLSRHHLKVGFREGAGQSQDDARQRGFDEGFAAAARETAELAWCRGVVSGVQMMIVMRDGPAAASGLSDLEELLSEIKMAENRVTARRDAPADDHATVAGQPQRNEQLQCPEHQLCAGAVKSVDGPLLERLQSVLERRGFKLPIERQP
ncbi:uncharacterized protein LOC135816567 [Sycon ciliatum]|uniref:uncharacterized protein LOC135816567 n=1 Tax=Sycon ciliatum TaxID=27933 RepID=UPI0031F6F191|eukprot:scpid76690/ scgid21435/ 